jgi:hypothetical protein
MKNQKKSVASKSIEIRVPKRLAEDALAQVEGGVLNPSTVLSDRTLLTGPYDDYAGGVFTCSGDSKK